jgi:hypothetical protein
MNNKEFIVGKLKEDDFSALFTNVTPSTKEEDIKSMKVLYIKEEEEEKTL